jgi:hypothetical protein
MNYRKGVSAFILNDNTTIVNSNITIQELKEIFNQYRRLTIENKIRTLFEIITFDVRGDNKNIQKKIRELE